MRYHTKFRKKIGRTVAVISRFNGFKNGNRPASCMFKIHFYGRAVKRHILHHCAKFRDNPPCRCWDIVIFRFSNMAAAVNLDFQKFEILTVDQL